MSLLVFVWNLKFLSKNFILCGESSSTYQSPKIVVLFFPSPGMEGWFYCWILPVFCPSMWPHRCENKNRFIIILLLLPPFCFVLLLPPNFFILFFHYFQNLNLLHRWTCHLARARSTPDVTLSLSVLQMIPKFL